MPNVLADRHHSGLFHSLQLLAQRMGWTLYTPHGHEWWDEWYWSFGRSAYNDDRLARQFLMGPEEPDNEFPDAPIRFVTLEEAKAMPWEYVIATVEDNQRGFAKFARETGAKYVLQVGNTSQPVDWGLDPLALVSSEVPINGRGIRYHQEMDPIEFREPIRTSDTEPLAASFVNCMPSMGHCWDLLEEAQSLALSVTVHGIDGQWGVVKPFSRLLELMALADWGWHDKHQGDGFGHVIHAWAAVGRPLIGHASHYRGRMAEPFWRDMETCIDLDKHSVSEVVEIVRTITSEKHAEMCRAIRGVFDSLVDYDREAAEIARFLGVPISHTFAASDRQIAWADVDRQRLERQAAAMVVVP